MATGVRGAEIASKMSTVANVEQVGVPPLPPAGSLATFGYSNRATLEKILAVAAPRYVEIGGEETSDEVRIEPNSFLLSDNLFGLRAIVEAGHKARLIYMDPPYGTGSDFQSRDQSHAYSDRGVDAATVESMRQRLILARECLADDGSIYVHIGHHLLGHIKVIMDEVFGQSNFKNIITRRKCSSKNFTKNSYPNLNDFVLFYTKSREYIWNQPTKSPDDQWIKKEYPKIGPEGRFKLVPLHAPGSRNGETGKPWRGVMPPKGKHWQYAPDFLDELDKRGDIHWSKNGNPRRKVHLGTDKRVAITDYWSDFRDAHHQSVRITGYPTEKNLDMLKMIVSASSNVGDLVIDPFCGSGTTLEAAALMGRQWIGIDRSFEAARKALERLRTGTAPMGDFVATGLEGKSMERSMIHRFSFLADARLLSSDGDELNQLASI